MRVLKWLFLALLGLSLLGVASANRELVVLRLVPEQVDSFFGFGLSVKLPLFLVIFAGIVAGLAIGFVWEWLRESKHRSAATQHRREAGRLAREVDRLKADSDQPEDDVLALLERKGAR
ncbi:LapA family protein [Defluviimonas sp. WL0002]|uniref:LapA family protein n=1 Tax=Albidovulum marisflavi TaxID=2984159 RepID=A0ABT2ZC67_9RHOB|nr:LapA family protein [Defluviimonas sp. WL0002]